MDQMAAAHATARHALLIETADGSMTPIPFDLPVLLLETGVSHRLADGEYNRRRAECGAALEACRSAGVDAPILAGVQAHALEPLRRRDARAAPPTAATRGDRDRPDPGGGAGA